MIGVDAGSGDRLALAVLTQYRMATTEQMHRVIAPEVRIEQTRRRLARLRVEGLVDRITLPQAGRTRVWFPTAYGVQLACEWPEMRGRRSSRTVSDPIAVRLKVGHTLTVAETALAFLEDARRRGDLCGPLDWIPEVHHPTGSGEAVIPDALMYYRRGSADGDDGSMLRAFVEVDRATMGPERLAAKLPAYERLYQYVPIAPGRRPTFQEPAQEEWRRRYPFFPRILFVLDGTGSTGVENRIRALRAGAGLLAASGFVYDVPVFAASLGDLVHHGPSAPVRRPVRDPDQRVHWTGSGRRQTWRAAAGVRTRSALRFAPETLAAKWSATRPARIYPLSPWSAAHPNSPGQASGAGQLPQLGARRRCRGGGLPVGVPPQAYGQVQQAAAQVRGVTGVGRGECVVGGVPGVLRLDQVVGEVGGVHLLIRSLVRIFCHADTLPDALTSVRCHRKLSAVAEGCFILKAQQADKGDSDDRESGRLGADADR